MTNDHLSALFLEITLGMRAQSSGRDQNAMIVYLRTLPEGQLDYDFIIDEETVVRIEDPVPPGLWSKSWCIIPGNPGAVVCRSRDGGHERPGELVRGISFEEAQGMGAFLYADAGACVELVYPGDIPAPDPDEPDNADASHAAGIQNTGGNHEH